MKLSRLPLLAVFLAALCAPVVHAQDAQKPAAAAAAPAEAQRSKPKPGDPADPKIIEKIFVCIAPGLTKDWKKAWIVINEIGRDEAGTTRNYAADFFFATSLKDQKGKKLVPCGAGPVLEGVSALQDYLPENQRRWTGATLTFTSERGGVKFNANYDYTPRKLAPAAAEPAKPAAKKSDPSTK